MIIYQTSKASDRLKVIHENDQKLTYESEEVLTISNTYDQTILGFGGAFTESAAYNLGRVNKELRTQMIKAYFDPIEGIGYRLGRVSINSSDFGLHTYTYVDDHDIELKTFNIDRDQHIIDLILDAQKILGEPIEILASPWSPPAWMKDNQSAIRGGKLLPHYRELWAKYMITFIKAYQEKGVWIESVTIQNEPLASQRWESCIYESADEADMVIALGKALKEAQLPIKIYIWDHNRDVMFQRSQDILSQPEALQFVSGIAFHWYDKDQFLEVKKTHKAFPNMNLLFTEGCQEGGPHLHNYEVGERYGINMMHDIHHGTVGYIDWNLFLDTTGGPNHVNNLCSSPVMLDVFPEVMIKNPSYYYIAHFSKFVKQGAKRLETFSTNPLLHNVFHNPNGELVLVIMNTNDHPIKVKWVYEEKKYETILPSHSIQTIII